MSNQVIDWLESQQDNMLGLLGELVNIDSNSFDKAGVDRVANRLAEFFDAQSIPARNHTHHHSW